MHANTPNLATSHPIFLNFVCFAQNSGIFEECSNRIIPQATNISFGNFWGVMILLQNK